MLEQCEISRPCRWRFLHVGVLLLTVAAALFAQTIGSCADSAVNSWLGKTSDWGEGSNWSSGASPSAGDTAGVVVGAAEGRKAPVLGKDASVGASLLLEKGTRLDLNGHKLQMGMARQDSTASTADPAKSAFGLKIENGAVLDSGSGPAEITLSSGGLVTLGEVKGKISLIIPGRSGSFLLDGGKGLELAGLALGPSPFPYQVKCAGGIYVAGNLEIAGGRLIVGPSPASFQVNGDLIFRGGNPPAMLVTEGNLILHGTIKSEGSAFCVEVPGEQDVWNKAETTARCYTKENAGWVCMVGTGDQEITPGGILPPIRIEKRSGIVACTGDLHCTGLHVTAGSTLDMSKGHRLIIGHYQREWTGNPELNGRPEFLPCRRSRDLVNEGRLIGSAQGLPVTFLLNWEGTRYVVDTVYKRQEANADHPAAAGGKQSMSALCAAPGSLAINRYMSRLALKDGKLFLDGKPCDSSGRQSDADAGQDLLDDVLKEGGTAGKDGLSAPDDKAVVSVAGIKTVPAEFAAPAATPANVAPFVERIRTPARGSTAFNVNGPFWGQRDAYGAVDGDTECGTGGAEYYDFIFPEPVNVGAVRLFSGDRMTDACQFVVTADTDGNGKPEQVLAWTRGGVPPDIKSWMALGSSWAVFPPRKISCLRLQVLSPSGAVCRPTVNEFEIYADKESADRLAGRNGAQKPTAPPENAPSLSQGGKVEAEWPETPKENRVTRVVAVAFWMAGIAWGAGIDESAYEKLPPLKDYPQCKTLLDEVKNKYHFDAMQIFFEGEKVGFPWPSVNFKSSLNAKYLNQREVALKIRAALKKEKGGDKILDDLEKNAPAEDLTASDMKVKEPEGKFSEELKIEDLPNQRNLLKEFCEAAHEKGLAVSLISRPEDMGKLYIGPKDKDPYEAFLRDGAAAGVDLVSLTPDEEHPLWQCGGYARWQEFERQNQDKVKKFTLTEKRKFYSERNVIAGECMKERMDNILKVSSQCRFLVDGARLLNGGDPFDVIWHVADPDYTGCSYQSQLVPRWAATSRKRAVAIGEYPHRSVRYNLESLLLGAKMIRTYRFNYIELQKSEDQRIRENIFIEQFMKWGATRPSHPPTALLVSRASEAYWPEDCRAGRMKSQSPDRCWAVEEILYEFLLKNGYTFDVYYLDQTEDLKKLKEYPLVVLPFAYSVPKASFAQMEEAYKAGSNFLICERQGDVDELGQPYEKHLLAEWIRQGKDAGRIAYPELDLLELETTRGFLPKMAGVIDPLLGTNKILYLNRYGNRIEAVTTTISKDENYLSFINWENKAVRIEAGMPNLPAGQYRILTLSSAAPNDFREGSIAGEKGVSAEALRSFALKLDADEVLSLYIVPANRILGK